MKEQVKVYLIEILLKHKFAFVFSFFGFLFAFLILLVGFWRTFLLFLFIIVGWILGSIYDNGGSVDLFKAYNNIKSKFSRRSF